LFYQLKLGFNHESPPFKCASVLPSPYSSVPNPDFVSLSCVVPHFLHRLYLAVELCSPCVRELEAVTGLWLLATTHPHPQNPRFDLRPTFFRISNLWSVGATSVFEFFSSSLLVRIPVPLPFFFLPPLLKSMFLGVQVPPLSFFLVVPQYNERLRTSHKKVHSPRMINDVSSRVFIHSLVIFPALRHEQKAPTFWNFQVESQPLFSIYTPLPPSGFISRQPARNHANPCTTTPLARAPPLDDNVLFLSTISTTGVSWSPFFVCLACCPLLGNLSSS